MTIRKEDCNWNCESISLTNKQQSLVMYVFESFIKHPYLLEEFNLHKRETKKDIKGNYLTTTILHNEEISDIYNTLKEQVYDNIKKENLIQQLVNLSEEDIPKVLTQLKQLQEVN